VSDSYYNVTNYQEFAYVKHFDLTFKLEICYSCVDREN